MKKNMASTGAIMAARMGQSARNPLLLFRATKNWQTARYRATAIQPARTSWIEFFPDTSKGSAPMINTKGESKPRTTESTIFPIRIPVLRPEITSRAPSKVLPKSLQIPDEIRAARLCYSTFRPATISWGGPPGPGAPSGDDPLVDLPERSKSRTKGSGADEGVRPTFGRGGAALSAGGLATRPTYGPSRNNGSARTASRAGSSLVVDEVLGPFFPRFR